MPSTGGRKFGRKGAQGPDTMDIDALLEACWKEWGISPWFVITQALDSGLMVECQASYRGSDGKEYTPSAVRIINPNVDNILHVMLQLGHVVYHQIDRNPHAVRAEVTDG